MLNHQFDEFNGIIIDAGLLPECAKVFAEGLAALLAHAKQHQTSVVWITVPIVKTHLIPILTQQGFTFHNCLETEMTLIHKSDVNDVAPFVPTHSLGAGGFVQRPNGDILCIREKGATTYKLPGGHVELGEKVEEAVIRETFEETGVMATFNSILALASTHPYRFGKSNIYIVCALTPVSEHIDIKDQNEVDDARWIAPDKFLAEETNSVFNKYLVKSLLNQNGLSKANIDLSRFSNRKHEVFLP